MLLLLLLSLSGLSVIHAQRANEVDSLKKLLPKLVESSARIKVLNRLASRLSPTDVAQSTKFAQEAIVLSIKLKDSSGLARAYNARAMVSRQSGNYQLALEDFLKALEIDTSLKNLKDQARTLNGIGAIYLLTENYNSALLSFQKAYEIRINTADSLAFSVSLCNLGNANLHLGDTSTAISQYLEAVSHDSTYNNWFDASYPLHSLGIAYQPRPIAERYLMRALEIRKAENHRYGIAQTSLELGRFYKKNGDLNRAYEYLKTAETYFGQLYASEMEQEALLELANLAYLKNEHEQASNLFYTYAVRQDSLSGAKRNKQFEQLRVRHQLDQQEQENELLKRDRALQTIQLDKKEGQVAILIVGIATVFGVLLILYFYYHRKNQLSRKLLELNVSLQIKQEEILSQAEALKDANSEISRINQGLEIAVNDRTKELQIANSELQFYLYHSAHDLRRPITSIKGLANIAKMTLREKDALMLFEKVEETASNMLKMIQKLNMLSEIRNYETVKETISFWEIVQMKLSYYKEVIDEKNISIKIDAETDLEFESDKLLCQIIIQNLIENAVVFCQPGQSTIQICGKKIAGKILIEISDNGIGIAQENLLKIFDLYFKATEESKGNGIGLYLVRVAIEKLGGTVEIESELGQRTTVRVMLPYKK